jgi:hypothetical protein
VRVCGKYFKMIPMQTSLEEKETRIRLPHLVYLRDLFMTAERVAKIIAHDALLADDLLKIGVNQELIELTELID